jgi:hypothetical protein
MSGVWFTYPRNPMSASMSGHLADARCLRFKQRINPCYLTTLTSSMFFPHPAASGKVRDTGEVVGRGQSMAPAVYSCLA